MLPNTLMRHGNRLTSGFLIQAVALGVGLRASNLRMLDLLVTDYAGRILGFDPTCAEVWGRLMPPTPNIR